ncbi:MAG: hypothetical protein Q9165_008276 [Trypethelium subeluteriae]
MCSSLIPTGKTDLRGFIGWAEYAFELPCLRDFLDAVPTAELTPLESKQTDEEEMKMTYAELSVFGRLRKVDRQGPYSMFQTLLHTWDHLTPSEIAVKGNNPDDNRYDMRPFLLPQFDLAYRKMDQEIEMMKAMEEGRELNGG